MANPLRSLQPELTKNKIVLSLEQLMQDKSIKEITIREICRHANVSVGTFYIYFSCKEEAILYIYRSADAAFKELVLSDDPMANVELLLKTFFEMVDVDNLAFVKQLYICHLSYNDEYYLSEDREFFQLMERQVRCFSQKHSKEITWELLEYGRGKIYNYCVSHEKGDIRWYVQALQKTISYFKFLLNDENVLET